MLYTQECFDTEKLSCQQTITIYGRREAGANSWGRVKIRILKNLGGGQTQGAKLGAS